MASSEDRRIAALAEVPEAGTLLFTVREGFDEVEVVLVRLADGVAAWKNYSSVRTSLLAGGRTPALSVSTGPNATAAST